MEKQIRRLVVCDVCGTKYAFIQPQKPGVFRIECPKCKKPSYFKVVAK